MLRVRCNHVVDDFPNEGQKRDFADCSEWRAIEVMKRVSSFLIPTYLPPESHQGKNEYHPSQRLLSALAEERT